MRPSEYVFTNFQILTVANEGKTCAELTVSIEKPESSNGEKTQQQFILRGLKLKLYLSQ